ncbi:hypothetical protein [Rhodococcus marinonascens]|uniref:hypothetical protein n=1 Tax=Rhodococcus marinonascens TaxID=38311 RepID=UPI0009345585|nr:hypothetical protein [Rhodococcus marinonascens]
MKTLTATQAAAMWSDLRGHFVNAERKIIEIIEARAWEPLGFESFAEAWASKMAGVRLATDEVRAHVVYAMFDGGMDDEQINANLGVGSGVSDRQVKVLRRQRSNGVPVSLASTVVRSHYRRRPSEPRTIRVELHSAEYARYVAIAKDLERDVADIATEAVRLAFGELA